MVLIKKEKKKTLFTTMVRIKKESETTQGNSGYM